MQGKTTRKKPNTLPPKSFIMSINLLRSCSYARAAASKSSSEVKSLNIS